MSEDKSSKQKRWQEAKALAGLCITCGKNPAEEKCYCAACAERQRDKARARYRLKKGIPLDAPLMPNGRPRRKDSNA